jgi:hypothetical protein
VVVCGVDRELARVTGGGVDDADVLILDEE